MWTRGQIKERAKISFKRNYWKTVLISILLSLFLTGTVGTNYIFDFSDSGISFDGISFDGDSFFHENKYNDVEESFFKGIIEDDEDLLNSQPYLEEAEDSSEEVAFTIFVLIFAVVFLVIFVVIAALVLVLNAFIFNPLEVGCRRFYLQNLNQAAEVKEIGFGYDHGYKNIAKTMFFRDLYTLLWSLLFIIPGIAKSYEYMMIPYLLADHPDMTMEQAFAVSKKMMQGNKWNAFVLDLSFIPWNILSAITCGVVGIFYVDPYKNMTYAALYETLKYGERK